MKLIKTSVSLNDLGKVLKSEIEKLQKDLEDSDFVFTISAFAVQVTHKSNANPICTILRVDPHVFSKQGVINHA